MLGASLVKGLSFISKGVSLNLNTSLYLVFGLIFAFITSLVVINTLLKFVKKHSFIGFGVYRIIIGILLIVLLSFNVIGGSF